MSRSVITVVAGFVGVALVIVLFVVIAWPDRASPTVNVSDLEDDREPPRRDVVQHPEVRHDALDKPPTDDIPDKPETADSPEYGFVVTGSVIATTGTVPAMLSVIATRNGHDPLPLELNDTPAFRFEFTEPVQVTLTVRSDAWYTLKPVVVDVNEGGVGADIKIAPAAMLDGRVDQSDGAVVSGGEVRIRSGGKVHAMTTTDASGYYEFRSLRPGSYRAEVSYGDNRATESLFIVVGENAENLTMDVSTTLTLRLLDQYGNAVAFDGDESVELRVQRGGYPMPSSAISESAGRPGEKLWSGLATGRYFADISVPGFEQQTARFDVSGAGHVEEVKLTRGGTILGEIIASGKLPESALRARTTHKGMRRTAALDEDNRFEFQSLGLGEYEVELVDATSQKVVASQKVDLAGGPQNVVFEVDPGATLEITLIEDGKVGSNVSAWVKLTNADGDAHWATAKDGKLAMAFLKPSTYTVSVRHFGDGFANFETEIEIREGENLRQLKLRKPNCLRVTWVSKGSSADKSGLKARDILLSFNGVSVTGVAELKTELDKLKQGDSATMKIVRNGVESELQVKDWPGKLGVSANSFHR